MDAEEFDDLYAASFGRLVHQLHAMIGDRDEAQECVQEAFVRAWSHRRRLDRSHAPEAWVRTTAYRLAVSRWRRARRGRREPDRALQPTHAAPAPSVGVSEFAVSSSGPSTTRGRPADSPARRNLFTDSAARPTA